LQVRSGVVERSGPAGAPFRQAANLYGQLLEAVRHVELGFLLLLFILLGREDIAADMAFVVLWLQRVEDGGHGWTLEGARSAAGQRILWLGRLQAREGAGRVQAFGSMVGHAGAGEDGSERVHKACRVPELQANVMRWCGAMCMWDGA
jgi:hypothetical protein